MRFQELDISQLPRDSKASTWLKVGPRADGSDWRLPFLYVIGATAGAHLACPRSGARRRIRRG